jgi:hypothetical protein
MFTNYVYVSTRFLFNVLGFLYFYYSQVYFLRPPTLNKNPLLTRLRSLVVVTCRASKIVFRIAGPCARFSRRDNLYICAPCPLATPDPAESERAKRLPKPTLNPTEYKKRAESSRVLLRSKFAPWQETHDEVCAASVCHRRPPGPVHLVLLGKLLRKAG